MTYAWKNQARDMDGALNAEALTLNGADVIVAGQCQWEGQLIIGAEHEKLPDCLNSRAAMLQELRETLRELEEWDGTPDAFEIIKENIRAAIKDARP
jgi:hypothetical protein